jgi:hypothetical protein
MPRMRMPLVTLALRSPRSMSDTPGMSRISSALSRILLSWMSLPLTTLML